MTHTLGMLRKGIKSSDRRGTSIIEFALCLPLILLLVFGAVEATDAIFLQQAITTAAYEGARTATTSSGTTATATAAANAVLTARGVTGATVSVSPAVSATTAAGTNVTVTVTVAINAANSLTNANFAGFLGRTLTASVVMTHR